MNPIPPWNWRDDKRLPADVAGKVVGNSGSRVFHRATCQNAAKIAAGACPGNGSRPTVGPA